MPITIDPNTLNIVDETGRSIRDPKDLTNNPGCPVCSEPVHIDQIYVTLNEKDRIENGDRYMLGRWECPHGCNPITRQRYHGSVELEGGPDSCRLKCSCGTDVTVLNSKFKEVMAAHPQGEYTDVELTS